MKTRIRNKFAYTDDSLLPSVRLERPCVRAWDSLKMCDSHAKCVRLGRSRYAIHSWRGPEHCWREVAQATNSVFESSANTAIQRSD